MIFDIKSLDDLAVHEDYKAEAGQDIVTIAPLERPDAEIQLTDGQCGDGDGYGDGNGDGYPYCTGMGTDQQRTYWMYRDIGHHRDRVMRCDKLDDFSPDGADGAL